MRFAYDTLLTDCVDAENAAQSSDAAPYRYECACCGEEVHLCAANSQIQATHFRHRSGNNNVECENYYGKRSAIINNALSRRKAQDKVEFYFSSETKMFSISVKFSAEEISEYGQKGSVFQVRKTFDKQPVLSVPISTSRFLPDNSELIPISKFAWQYDVSILNETSPKNYVIFKKNEYPSFFKIQTGDDATSFMAKLVRSQILYTNTKYLLVFFHQLKDSRFFKGVEVENIISFRTMHRDFAGVVISITRKTPPIQQQLEEWRYTLESNETLNILWPPSSQINESIKVSTDSIYLYSSFELQAHGNINTRSSDIIKQDNGISKVRINGQTKIYKRNAELVINKCEEEKYEYKPIVVLQEKSEKYLASDDHGFLFNRSGVTQIANGITVLLTPGSEVRHYLFGYLDKIVTSTNCSVDLTGDLLLQDILLNYKRMETFIWEDYESLELSYTASQYIEECKLSGVINSAVKNYIEEGWI